MTLVRLVGGPLDLDGTFIPCNLKPKRVVDDENFVSHEYYWAPFQVRGSAVATYVGLANGPESYGGGM